MGEVVKSVFADLQGKDRDDLLVVEGKLIVDLGVYNRNRLFRLPGSHKGVEKDRRELPPLDDFLKMCVTGKQCPAEGVLIKGDPTQPKKSNKRKAESKRIGREHGKKKPKPKHEEETTIQQCRPRVEWMIQQFLDQEEREERKRQQEFVK